MLYLIKTGRNMWETYVLEIRRRQCKCFILRDVTKVEMLLQEKKNKIKVTSTKKLFFGLN